VPAALLTRDEDEHDAVVVGTKRWLWILAGAESEREAAALSSMKERKPCAPESRVSRTGVYSANDQPRPVARRRPC
jgi:hypothetical protein